ncbi:MAG: hypothetical protein HKN04_09635 [Rhodothermaceae bacterium]|nr:hypothetical protein [Rhodothermaceae bacterium]
MLRLLRLGSVLLGLGLAACAPEPDASPSPSRAETPMTSAPVTADDSVTALEASERALTDASDSTEWTLDDTHMDRLRQRGSTLLSLRAAAHDASESASSIGYDRVVFTFDDLVPGYRIAYVGTSVYHCGSGEPVSVAGDGWLEVEFFPAAAHTDETYEPTITEPWLPDTLPLLRDASMTCDFEGYVTWVLGLDAAIPYRVLELTDPARLVLDVQHEC